jgi:hypothetical protein
VSVTYGAGITRASQEFTVANPLFGSGAADASAPAVQLLSVTIAASGSVIVNPCVNGDLGCPDPTPGYASIPFPSAVLPVYGGTYITWMFQDLSYTGNIEMTVAFVQLGVVVGLLAHLSGVVLDAGFTSLTTDDQVVPPEASPGPAMVVVSLNYGGNIARASQTLTLQ